MSENETKEGAMIAMEGQKTCPFCGGEPHIGGGPGIHYVKCWGCRARTGLFATATEALEAWNRRIK